jgi:hypothetical protein
MGKAGSAATADARPHQQKILHSCQQHAEQFAAALFKQVMDKLDDALFERGNKGGPSAEQFVDAARELRLRRQELFGSFFDKFSETYKSRLKHAAFAAAAGAKGVRGGGLSLSLVDEQDLEESLAVDGLVAKANDRLRNELFALAQRFNRLIDGAQYKEDALPLSPDVIAHALRDAFHLLEWKVEIKLVAFKLLEQIALHSLSDFYRDTNALLSKAGVLPELKPAIAIRTAGGASPVRAAPHETPAESGQPSIEDGFSGGVVASSGPAAVSAAVVDTYQTLQRLMNARKYGGGAGETSAAGAAGPGAGTISALPADDLVRGLSLLQHDTLPGQDGVVTINAIKGALLDQMRQLGDGRGIHPAHDNTIDVIGMIFEFILDEPSIPDLVKNLLNRLQIPILKVAISDKGFFTNKGHPARRLLNVLGHASIGWNDNAEEVRRRRFEKMEYVVGRVLADFEQDPGIFAELLEDFTAFLRHEATEGGEIPVPASEEQPEEDTPDRLAFETIEVQLEGVEVPEFMRGFLRGTWREVLQHALDHEGRDSATWRRRQQTLADLIWSVEPKTVADDRRRMVMLLPRLLDELRDGMTLLQRTPQEMDALLDALEPIHMACLRGERPVQETVRPREPSPAAEPAVTDEVTDVIRLIQAEMGEDAQALLAEVTAVDESAPAEEHVSADEMIEDQFTSQAADMKLGTWLEFDLDGKKRRAKLAWKSAVMGEYVFVDRTYKVVAERTLASLAAALRHGRAAPVENVAMFDRALDKVLNGLMSGGKTAH